MRRKMIVLVGLFLIAQRPLCFAEKEESKALPPQISHSFASGQWDEVIQWGEKALDQDLLPHAKADLLFYLSSAYLHKGILLYGINRDDHFFQKAITYAHQCLSVNPRYWQALENLGMTSVEMKKLEQADQYYKQAERYADPDSPGFQELVVRHTMVREGLRLRYKRD